MSCTKRQVCGWRDVQEEKSFNEALRQQPGSLQKEVAKLHFFTAVKVRTTPPRLTCGSHEEFFFGITTNKMNIFIFYLFIYFSLKKILKSWQLYPNIFFLYFCLILQQLIQFFLGMKRKRMLKEKCFWKMYKSASKSIWDLKTNAAVSEKHLVLTRDLKKPSAGITSANSTSVAQHLLTLFTKLSLLAVFRCVNPLGLLFFILLW